VKSAELELAQGQVESVSRAGMVALRSRVLRLRWRKKGIVQLPETGPPLPAVKPGREPRLTENGVVWQLVPTGTSSCKSLDQIGPVVS
jgi:hypothetical protein